MFVEGREGDQEALGREEQELNANRPHQDASLFPLSKTSIPALEGR
jgi:hypothetical protein